MKNKIFWLLCLLMGSTAFCGKAETLLAEKFVRKQRLVENLPETAAWYTAYASSGLKEKSGTLISENNRYAIAYFTARDTFQQLNPGDSLTVSCVFSMAAPQASNTGLRIGVLNSGGKRIGADNIGLTHSIFTDYAGYAFFLNLQSRTAMRIEKRNRGVSDKLIHSSVAYTDLAKDQGEGTRFSNGKEYTANIKLQRTASGMEVSLSLVDEEGYSASVEDPGADAVSAFDTFVIYGAASAMGSFTLHSVDVNYNPGQ